MITAVQRQRMIEKAWMRDGIIFPCGTRRTIEDSFEEWPGKVILFYNITTSKTTHVIVEEVAPA